MNRRFVTPTFQSARAPVGKPALRPCPAVQGFKARALARAILSKISPDAARSADILVRALPETRRPECRRSARRNPRDSSHERGRSKLTVPSSKAGHRPAVRAWPSASFVALVRQGQSHLRIKAASKQPHSRRCACLRAVNDSRSVWSATPSASLSGDRRSVTPTFQSACSPVGKPALRWRICGCRQHWHSWCLISGCGGSGQLVNNLS